MGTPTLNVYEAGSVLTARPPAAKSLKTVDVVIPCHNYARYLRACVQSVLAQDGVHPRILIIDDASSDCTAELGSALAAEYEQVEFRRHVTNRGHIATYNEGVIDWSNADYCALLSADDLLAPGCLSRAVAIMESDRRIGMVYGRAIPFAKESELPGALLQSYSWIRYPGNEWVAQRCRAGQNVITSPEVVVRGSIQRAVGGYRQSLPHAQDFEMWLRIAAISDLAFVQGAVQAYYRVHHANQQPTKCLPELSDFVQRKAAFDSFFLYYVDTTGEAFRVQDSANRALAREALWDVCRAYDHGRVDPEREDELVDFAISAFPQATSLPEYRALRRRRFFGSALCHRTQLFFFSGLCAWVLRAMRKRRWKRYGV
jgi:glycosyltransferase involved in cell wall biosynthesis